LAVKLTKTKQATCSQKNSENAKQTKDEGSFFAKSRSNKKYLLNFGSGVFSILNIKWIRAQVCEYVTVIKYRSVHPFVCL
jgi:hypothetical protein